VIKPYRKNGVRKKEICATGTVMIGMQCVVETAANISGKSKQQTHGVYFWRG
jgi:hypothetical protein